MSFSVEGHFKFSPQLKNLSINQQPAKNSVFFEIPTEILSEIFFHLDIRSLQPFLDHPATSKAAKSRLYKSINVLPSDRVIKNRRSLLFREYSHYEISCEKLPRLLNTKIISQHVRSMLYECSDWHSILRFQYLMKTHSKWLANSNVTIELVIDMCTPMFVRQNGTLPVWNPLMYDDFQSVLSLKNVKVLKVSRMGTSFPYEGDSPPIEFPSNISKIYYAGETDTTKMEKMIFNPSLTNLSFEGSVLLDRLSVIKNLKWLNISKSVIPAGTDFGVLKELVNLETIFLKEVEFKEVVKLNFSSLVSLSRLSLSSCKITNNTISTLRTPNGLKSLSLNNNGLGSMDLSQVLINNSDMEFLQLIGNNLKTLPLKLPVGLVELDLGINDLCGLDIAHLLRLKSLNLFRGYKSDTKSISSKIILPAQMAHLDPSPNLLKVAINPLDWPDDFFRFYETKYKKAHNISS